MARGRSVQIRGLSRQLHSEFRRAVAIDGCSMSQWLAGRVRQFVRSQKQKHGDLFSVLTPEEREIIEVIQDGAAEFDYLVEETMLPARRVEAILSDLIDRGIVEPRVKGGKTDRARGARITLYFVTEKYQSKSE
jgi:hypothetical protein